MASKDAVQAEVCMHEEGNEAMDESSQDNFEDVGKVMVEAMQEEASQGVGQPCPTNCVEERQCIPESVDDLNILEHEVIDGFLSRLADDMVVEVVLEEQVDIQELMIEQSDLLSHKVVEDVASKAMVGKDWQSGMECILFEGHATTESAWKIGRFGYARSSGSGR
ncbi:hypothetical protein GOP47_0021161 [Adiantum capillus-veneris]|uniref:Uncharacterized protein n=1 Tax=Adiantum capillus-veneris TaxID=13818 RepID=A0A9D4UAL5_ADICA|nr:hypothetical protein GOP47_0021161 [Adiantum capillus-veneris]